MENWLTCFLLVIDIMTFQTSHRHNLEDDMLFWLNLSFDYEIPQNETITTNSDQIKQWPYQLWDKLEKVCVSCKVKAKNNISSVSDYMGTSCWKWTGLLGPAVQIKPTLNDVEKKGGESSLEKPEPRQGGSRWLLLWVWRIDFFLWNATTLFFPWNATTLTTLPFSFIRPVHLFASASTICIPQRCAPSSLNHWSSADALHTKAWEIPQRQVSWSLGSEDMKWNTK